MKYDARLLLAAIRGAGLPAPVEEYMFASPRRWRFDMAWPEKRLAVEVEGKVWGGYVRCNKCGAHVKKRTAAGTWYNVREAGGRHTSGAGYLGDMEKYNMAAALGWRIIRLPAHEWHKKEYIHAMVMAYNYDGGVL